MGKDTADLYKQIESVTVFSNSEEWDDVVDNIVCEIYAIRELKDLTFLLSGDNELSEILREFCRISDSLNSRRRHNLDLNETIVRKQVKNLLERLFLLRMQS